MSTCPHCHSQVPDGYVACPNCKGYLDATIYGQGRPLDNPRQALDSLRTELQGLRKSQEAGLERLRRLERALDALTGFIGQQEPFTPPVSEQPEQQVQAAEPEPQRPQLEEEEFSFQEHGEQEPEFRISTAKDSPTPTIQAVPPAAPQEPLRPLTPPRPRKSPKEKISLESALGQKGLLAIGIVVMIFGVGYFLKYTFDKGIIGPVGQVGLAYAWGMLLLAGGELARRKGYRQYGLWVLAGGVASLYFATFAAYRIFEIMGMVPAFLLLVGATLLAIAMALRYDVLGLAFLGILGGFLTPLMLSTGQDNMFFLYGYLTVLNAGVLATAFFKRWTGLSWLGLVGTMLLFAGWMWDGYHKTDFWPTFIFLSITFLGYTLAPVLGTVFRREEDAKSLTGARKAVYIGIPASFYTFGYTYEIVTERFGQKACAIPCLAYAAIFGACAWFLFKHFRNTPGKGGSLVLAANAVLFAVLAVPITLDAHWITIVWALQGGVLAYLGYKLGGRGLFLLGQCLLYLALCRYFLQDLPDTFGWISNPKFKDMTGAQFTFYGGYTRMLAGRLLTEAVLAAGLFLGAWVRPRLPVSTSGKATASFTASDFARLMFITGLFLILNIECTGFFGDYAPDARAAALSVLWGLFATGLMLYGFKKRSPGSRHLSLGLFAITLLKVVMVDMEKFSTPYRILSFLALGSLLVGASFLYHKYKERLEDRLGGE